ncbi:DUF429 domain-containing protein [Sinomonas atrocyanea]|uniref:DUF429 domain-containing protein n=1 Tax=Sinomonas atrocyanea TaxID=37927 RepID=UPI002863CD8A|nr:DUF429 domain-containing protein [Sinomonas atrocyanea]MDR6621068.1 putative nuclease with RNAse H fold [Sinomonas atrocyanea]
MAAVAVGIDVGLLAGRGLDLVALDVSRKVVHTARHLRDLDELVRIVKELSPDVVCIDSPSQWTAQGRRRPAEQELTRRGINLYSTPSEDRASDFHSWMRDGFKVYGALAGPYPRYTGGEVRGKAAEYYPHASAVALMGRIGVFADKAQIRRMLLAEHGVDTESLVGLDQVDAALGALTGLIALEGRHSWVGDGSDTLLLPVQVLAERYRRDESSARERTASNPADKPTASDPIRAACLCGCGNVPAGRRSRFMPGHDHRVNPATGRRWNGLP